MEAFAGMGYPVSATTVGDEGRWPIFDPNGENVTVLHQIALDNLLASNLTYYL